MSSAAITVYTGFWINWTHGLVHGSTITLTAENSAFLVAFVALWVRFAGGQLWTVVTFLASITRSTTDPQDALYHQRQAILRNTSQPSNVMWAMVKLSWYWKGAARRVRTRTFTFIFGCLAYIAAFAVAGIFSSRLSSTDSEVLLLPTSSCGMWNAPEQWDPSMGTFQDWNIEESLYISNINQLTHQSHVYVSQCYNSSLNNANQPCLPYGKNRISWTTRSVACPYDEDMCIADAVEFDTGFLRSDTHLGVNTKNKHVEFRKVMTCAPITTDGYVAGYFPGSELNLTDGLNTTYNYGDSFLTYSYGQGIYFTDDTTYAYTNYSWDFSIGFWVPYRIYDMDVEFFAPSTTDTLGVSGLNTFEPIASLNRTDADLSLIFLSKNGSYLSEVHDPWFRATKVLSTTTVGVNESTSEGWTETVSTYQADEPNTVMACAEQYQLRNPATGATTPLGGSEFLTHSQARKLGLSEEQMGIYNHTFFYAYENVLGNTVSALGGSYLLAANIQNSFTSVGLPDNQWKLEFEHYFGVNLIAAQLWSQQYVTGTTNPELMNKYIVPAPEGYLRELCTKQIVRRTDHRSFSVLGLVIIFVLGFLFTVANLTIVMIVQKYQKHTEKGRYRNAEWQANEFLQLQRMTYQHDNVGTWTGHQDMVPRTNPGDLFTLPESTQWNHNIPEAVNKEGNGLLRTLTQASRRKSQAPTKLHSSATDTQSLDMDEKLNVSIQDPEKGGTQVFETQVKKE